MNGTVTRKTGLLNYKITTPDGKSHKRHTDQIIPNVGREPISEETHEIREKPDKRK